MKNIIESLTWRYATKKYDLTKKLSQEQIDMLLEAVRLAPTSFGLQPFRVLIINDPAVRAKLRAVGYDQAPITDASHFLVFAAMTNLSPLWVDEFVALTAKVRNVPIESLAGYHKMMSGSIVSRTPEQNIFWATKQAGIVMGVLLAAAAMSGIDATPMEGFDPKGFNEILGLDQQNITAIAAVALGFRAADDAYAKAAKVRFSKEVLIKNI